MIGRMLMPFRLATLILGLGSWATAGAGITSPSPIVYDFSGTANGFDEVTGLLSLAPDDVEPGIQVLIDASTSDVFLAGITNGVFTPLYAGITNGVFTPFVTFGTDDGGLPPIIGAQFDNGSETFKFDVMSPGVWSVEDSSGAVLYSGEGDFSPMVVPIPAAAWLFGSALLGLGVVKRKKA